MTCELCGSVMIDAGCTVGALDDFEDGIRRERIRWGDEGDGWAGDSPCHDCAALPGHYHHHNCDMERCPSCGDQLLSCGCRPALAS